MFTKEWFYDLENEIRARGADSDAQSFDEIREMLARPRRFTPNQFADMCAYVILAGGFSQRAAKKIHARITECIHAHGANFDELFAIFHNKNKINAICKHWENRDAYCNGYYACDCDTARIAYLQKLPHVGKITANHLARNLGVDVVKYDIWIQRLGVLYSGKSELYDKIDNGDLCDEIKNACDDMFQHLVHVTGFPRGYIDVVLWKACQIGLIKPNL
ncbi:MAG: hypothetical protein IJ560_03050 [Alphaproteobacteria bacterium]|nr:hypothetical protein [Alphaproteobacteria bacterium]